MFLLILRFSSPFSRDVTANAAKAYKDFRVCKNIKALTVCATGVECVRVGTVMTFEDDTESEEFCGFGLDLLSACEASAARTLDEYVRLEDHQTGGLPVARISSSSSSNSESEVSTISNSSSVSSDA